MFLQTLQSSLAPLLWRQKVPDYILGLDTRYFHSGFQWFASATQSRRRGTASNHTATDSFHILPNSLFTNHPVIQSYIIWTENNVKLAINQVISTVRHRPSWEANSTIRLPRNSSPSLRKPTIVSYPVPDESNPHYRTLTYPGSSHLCPHPPSGPPSNLMTPCALHDQPISCSLSSPTC
jgi:hypothetical protein